MARAAPAFSRDLLARARRVEPGTCVVCGCTELFACSGGCAWEPDMGERLCTAHVDQMKRQARAALAAADAERSAPRSWPR